eukprot:PhF_6_TR19785/c0_g1_i1/m.28848/K03120/TBP, tbp; transcription initiation factor TFIID TATA-box-binding protein
MDDDEIGDDVLAALDPHDEDDPTAQGNTYEQDTQQHGDQSIGSCIPIPNQGSPDFKVQNYFPRCPVNTTPVTTNTMCSVKIPDRIDMEALAIKCRTVEYNPTRSKTATFRLREPQCTAIIHGSGTVRLIGCRSTVAARVAAKTISKVIREVCGMNYTSVIFSTSMVSGRVDLRTPIRLADLATAYPSVCMYEPEVYSGVVVRLQYNIRCLVFVTGKLVFVGAKDLLGLRRAFEVVVPILEPFAKRDTMQNS